MIDGATQLIMMKADVLNSFDTIRVCTHYRLPDGQITENLPFDFLETQVEPVYKEFKGWETDITYASSFEQLPPELLEYIEFIEAETGLPITIISTGPDRVATILKEAVV
jgi:adenylosuccinate synthase